jgi:lipoprotein signal peptidase
MTQLCDTSAVITLPLNDAAGYAYGIIHDMWETCFLMTNYAAVCLKILFLHFYQDSCRILSDEGD